MEQLDKLRVLLPHWIEHNRGHAAECGKWSVLAREAGEQVVADHIDIWLCPIFSYAGT